MRVLTLVALEIAHRSDGDIGRPAVSAQPAVPLAVSGQRRMGFLPGYPLKSIDFDVDVGIDATIGEVIPEFE